MTVWRVVLNTSSIGNARVGMARGQRLGIGAVPADTIERDFAGGGRKRDQRAGWCRDGGEATTEAARQADERVVAAGIQNGDGKAARFRTQRYQDFVEIDALQEHFGLGANVDVDRQQVVFAETWTPWPA